MPPCEALVIVLKKKNGIQNNVNFFKESFKSTSPHIFKRNVSILNDILENLIKRENFTIVLLSFQFTRYLSTHNLICPKIFLLNELH